MPVEKLSISLERSTVEAIRDEARSRGVSLSAWLNEVAEEALAIKRGLAAVAEYEAEHGAFTDEELAWADAVLDAHGIGRAS